MDFTKSKCTVNVISVLLFLIVSPVYSADIETLKKECKEGKEEACLQYFLKEENPTDQTFLAEIAYSMKNFDVRELALFYLTKISEPLTAETKAWLGRPVKEKQGDWEKNVRTALFKGIPHERWPNIEWEDGIQTEANLNGTVPPGRYRFTISYSVDLSESMKRSSTDEIVLTATLALDTAYCIYSGATMNQGFWNPRISIVRKGAKCASIVK